MATSIQIPSPKRTMVVARQDGRLYAVDFSEHPQLNDVGAIDWNVSISKLLLGKVQLVRSRYVSLEEIEFENINPTGQPSGGDIQVTVFGSLNGKDLDATVTPTVVERTPDFIKLACRKTFQNFSVQLRGCYNLNTLILTIHNHGKR